LGGVLSCSFTGIFRVNNSSKILQNPLLESHHRYICGYPSQGRKQISKEEGRGKREEGRGKKEEGKGKKEKGRRNEGSTQKLGGRYSNPCRSRKFFTPPQPSPNPRGGSKKFTNDARIAIVGSAF
jgi:hypothetical protein